MKGEVPQKRQQQQQQQQQKQQQQQQNVFLSNALILLTQFFIPINTNQCNTTQWWRLVYGTTT